MYHGKTIEECIRTFEEIVDFHIETEAASELSDSVPA